MSSLSAELAPEDRFDAAEPARVIEIGEITAGIAVPEGRGVRFFSSARDFDGLDGAVFRTTAQAARAARERVSARAPSTARPDRARLRRA
ncbi:hypothetical protein ACLBX9_07830 [Methylobacterium sp. A49B]|uniref:Uncharacterized protein n=1 Tax=Methylobacterium mesophilicum SR1.6/6 TaxID=908290 RepID=A0A6B9FJE2_9HYPH|nr:hypothetical protein [Methylobacterium mesophilicum]MBE7249492.1 hypothetical protein [Actinomycetospora chiangmaiensis]QGY02099.1 hypothetical protein MMSR116_09560 [Methylobacterium mesophilicum SR1.6/6]